MQEVTNLNCSGLLQYHLKRIGPKIQGVADVIDFHEIRTLIGRTRSQVDNIFPLDSRHPGRLYISPCHAKIIREIDSSDDHRLVDVSNTGMFVNNVKIAESWVLSEGDLVTFGHPNGEKIPAGVRERQPKSEYHFIFERCQCYQENTMVKSTSSQTHAAEEIILYRRTDESDQSVTGIDADSGSCINTLDKTPGSDLDTGNSINIMDFTSGIDAVSGGIINILDQTISIESEFFQNSSASDQTYISEDDMLDNQLETIVETTCLQTINNDSRHYVDEDIPSKCLNEDRCNDNDWKSGNVATEANEVESKEKEDAETSLENMEIGNETLTDVGGNETIKEKQRTVCLYTEKKNKKNKRKLDIEDNREPSRKKICTESETHNNLNELNRSVSTFFRIKEKIKMSKHFSNKIIKIDLIGKLVKHFFKNRYVVKEEGTDNRDMYQGRSEVNSNKNSKMVEISCADVDDAMKKSLDFVLSGNTNDTDSSEQFQNITDKDRSIAPIYYEACDDILPKEESVILQRTDGSTTNVEHDMVKDEKGMTQNDEAKITTPYDNVSNQECIEENDKSVKVIINENMNGDNIACHQFDINDSQVPRSKENTGTAYVSRQTTMQTSNNFTSNSVIEENCQTNRHVPKIDISDNTLHIDSCVEVELENDQNMAIKREREFISDSDSEYQYKSITRRKKTKKKLNRKTFHNALNKNNSEKRIKRTVTKKKNTQHGEKSLENSDIIIISSSDTDTEVKIQTKIIKHKQNVIVISSSDTDSQVKTPNNTIHVEQRVYEKSEEPHIRDHFQGISTENKLVQTDEDCKCVYQDEAFENEGQETLFYVKKLQKTTTNEKEKIHEDILEYNDKNEIIENLIIGSNSKIGALNCEADVVENTCESESDTDTAFPVLQALSLSHAISDSTAQSSKNVAKIREKVRKEPCYQPYNQGKEIQTEDNELSCQFDDDDDFISPVINMSALDSENEHDDFHPVSEVEDNVCSFVSLCDRSESVLNEASDNQHGDSQNVVDTVLKSFFDDQSDTEIHSLKRRCGRYDHEHIDSFQKEVDSRKCTTPISDSVNKECIESPLAHDFSNSQFSKCTKDCMTDQTSTPRKKNRRKELEQFKVTRKLNTFSHDSVDERPCDTEEESFDGASDPNIDTLVSRCKDIISKLKENLNDKRLEENPRADQWKRELADVERTTKLPDTVIAVVGDTGSGKSSLMNAVIDQLDVLPTSGVRACTAVAVEITENTRNDKFEADIQFLSKKEWYGELKLLQKDLTGPDGKIKKHISDLKSEAGVAYLKIIAVYGKIDTFEVLSEDQTVTRLLGDTKNISCVNVEDFKKAIGKYIETSDAKGQYWPIVKLVSLRLPKCDACKNGAILVDLPGIRDSNAARDKISRDYLKNCTAVWVVSSVHRAIDCKIAKDLLGEHFKRQLMMDGQYSNIAFICTKSDDFVPSDIIRNLKIHDKTVPLENEINELQKKKNAADQQKSTVDREIRQLNGLIRNEKKNIDALKKVLKEIWESSDDSTDQDSIDAQKEYKLCLKSKEEKVILAEDNIGQKQLTINEARNRSLEIQEEISNKRKEIALVCARRRNEYVEEAIKRDFKAGLRGMKRKASTLSDEDDTMDEYDSESDDEEIRSTAHNLKVFCVSSLEYQKLRNTLTNDGPPKVFNTLEDTGILALRGCIHEMASNIRRQGLQRMIHNTARFICDVQVYLSHENTECTGTRSNAKSAIEERVFQLQRRFEPVIKELENTIDDIFSGLIQPKVEDGVLDACEKAFQVQEKWAKEPNKESPKDGGFYRPTYQALVRRHGVYKSPTFGSVDMNEELLEPMYTLFDDAWDDVFNNGKLQNAMETCRQKLLNIFKHFTTELCKELSSLGVTMDRTQKVKKQLVNSSESKLLEMMNEMNSLITMSHRDINRLPNQVVQEHMRDTYNNCASQSGKGMFNKMKECMAFGVNRKRSCMFNDAASKIIEELSELQRRIIGHLRFVCQNLLEVVQASFEPLWAAPVKTNTLRDILYDGITKVSLVIHKLQDDANIDSTFRVMFPASFVEVSAQQYCTPRPAGYGQHSSTTGNSQRGIATRHTAVCRTNSSHQNAEERTNAVAKPTSSSQKTSKLYNAALTRLPCYSPQIASSSAAKPMPISLHTPIPSSRNVSGLRGNSQRGIATRHTAVCRTNSSHQNAEERTNAVAKPTSSSQKTSKLYNAALTRLPCYSPQIASSSAAKPMPISLHTPIPSSRNVSGLRESRNGISSDVSHTSIPYPAPQDCFRQSPTPPTNWFKPGMKLEAVDNRNSFSTCIATVIYCIGPRILLRLDGNDNGNDFWKLVDSSEIYCFGQNELLPPFGFRHSDWNAFLKKTKKEARKGGNIAPEKCFINTPPSPGSNKFKVGMQLEAVDRKNPQLICPATVEEINEDGILVTFDGWPNYKDWYRYDSRDIFPVGWCAKSGCRLESPGNKGSKNTKQPPRKKDDDRFRFM